MSAAIQTLKRTAGSSLHHQLSGVLRSAIMSGRYGRGDHLPGEPVLMAMYGVSRATVRRALLTLENEKMIERHQGKGTIICWAPPTPKVKGRLKDRQHRGTTVEVLSAERIVPPAEIGAILKLPPGAQVLRTVRLRRRGGVAVWYVTNFLPVAFAANVDPEELGRMTMIATLALDGHVACRADDEVGATLADATIAAALDVAVGSPLIEVARTVSDADRRPLAYQWVLVRPDRHKLHIVVEGGAGDPIGSAAEPGPLVPYTRLGR